MVLLKRRLRRKVPGLIELEQHLNVSNHLVRWFVEVSRTQSSIH